MKVSKNLNILLRLILIPAFLLTVVWLIIKVPELVYNWSGRQDSPSPPVRSYGIIMPKGYTVHGIDVSKHQGNIDWKRAGLMNINGIKISFAFIKATEGISRQDHRFEINWKQAKANGFLRGAYLFYYPSRDAGKQAANFIKTVRLSSGDLPPVIDIEYSNGKSAAKICQGLKICIEKLEKQYHVKPILYTNINFYNTYLEGSFTDYPLWIAGYFDHDRFYNEFSTPWTFWQHSEKGKVDGIREYVDFNVFKGTIEKLQGMTIK